MPLTYLSRLPDRNRRVLLAPNLPPYLYYIYNNLTLFLNLSHPFLPRSRSRRHPTVSSLFPCPTNHRAPLLDLPWFFSSCALDQQPAELPREGLLLPLAAPEPLLTQRLPCLSLFPSFLPFLPISLSPLSVFLSQHAAADRSPPSVASVLPSHPVWREPGRRDPSLVVFPSPSSPALHHGCLLCSASSTPHESSARSHPTPPENHGRRRAKLCSVNRLIRSTPPSSSRSLFSRAKIPCFARSFPLLRATGRAPALVDLDLAPAWTSTAALAGPHLPRATITPGSLPVQLVWLSRPDPQRTGRPLPLHRHGPSPASFGFAAIVRIRSTTLVRLLLGLDLLPRLISGAGTGNAMI